MKFKSIFFSLLFLVPASGMAAQQSTDSILASLQKLLLEHAALPHETVVLWHPDTKALQIGRHLLPVTGNTNLNLEKTESGVRVNFFLQQGTAVTDLQDPAFRRASWQISLNSRRAGKQLIQLLEQLKNA